MKTLVILLTLLTSIFSHARSWETLQEIAENKYLGRTIIFDSGNRFIPSKDIILDSPVSEIILSRLDNPAYKLISGVFLMPRGDQDLVEIHLISETGLSTANCRFIVTPSNYYGQIDAWVDKCNLVDNAD